MSLFDSVKSAVADMGGIAQVGKGLASFVDQQGGLQAVMSKFEEQGLGSVVQSWIGTGANEAISADNIKKVIGEENLNALGQKIGMSTDDIAGKVATFLPTIVDKLSPNGSLPEGAKISDLTH